MSRKGYNVATTNKKQEGGPNKLIFSILITLTIILAAASVTIYFLWRSARVKAYERELDLSMIEGWMENVDNLEETVCNGTTDELLKAESLSLGDILHNPTDAEMAKWKTLPEYAKILFSKKYYWSLEDDVQIALSKEKARGVLKQLSADELQAIKNGSFDLGKYGINFSDQKQRVAEALERHFINVMLKVAKEEGKLDDSDSNVPQQSGTDSSGSS